MRNDLGDAAMRLRFGPFKFGWPGYQLVDDFVCNWVQHVGLVCTPVPVPPEIPEYWSNKRNTRNPVLRIRSNIWRRPNRRVSDRLKCCGNFCQGFLFQCCLTPFIAEAYIPFASFFWVLGGPVSFRLANTATTPLHANTRNNIVKPAN